MLEIARVVASHPGSHKVDLIYLTTGRRAAGVPVLSGMAGTDVGFADLPAPAVQDPSNPYDGPPQGQRDIYAAVLHANGIPHVIGFVYPEASQMLFNEPGRMIYRHGSGFYLTIDKDGNFEVRHPNGTGIAIGTPADLSKNDFDQSWQVPDNDKQTPISFAVSNSTHGTVCAFSVAPDGSMAFSTAGNMSFTAPKVVVTGDVEVSGDVVASGISLVNHLHGGVTTGGGKTDKPE